MIFTFFKTLIQIHTFSILVKRNSKKPVTLVKKVVQSSNRQVIRLIRVTEKPGCMPYVENDIIYHRFFFIRTHTNITDLKYLHNLSK